MRSFYGWRRFIRVAQSTGILLGPQTGVSPSWVAHFSRTDSDAAAGADARQRRYTHAHPVCGNSFCGGGIHDIEPGVPTARGGDRRDGRGGHPVSDFDALAESVQPLSNDARADPRVLSVCLSVWRSTMRLPPISRPRSVSCAARPVS